MSSVMTPFRTYAHGKPETWATHLERFEIWVDGRGITSDEQKRGLLLDTLDDTTIRNLKTWVAPRRICECTYEQIVLKLDEKITPTINWLVRYATLTRRTQRIRRRLHGGCEAIGGFLRIRRNTLV